MAKVVPAVVEPTIETISSFALMPFHLDTRPTSVVSSEAITGKWMLALTAAVAAVTMSATESPTEMMNYSAALSLTKST